MGLLVFLHAQANFISGPSNSGGDGSLFDPVFFCYVFVLHPVNFSVYHNVSIERRKGSNFLNYCFVNVIYRFSPGNKAPKRILLYIIRGILLLRLSRGVVQILRGEVNVFLSRIRNQFKLLT